MKQYFAKYLPVEGKIKKGDYVKCNGAQGIVTDTWDSITVLEKDGEEHNWRSDIPKLHKLFLCSRDIQIGDKVKLPQTKDDYKNNHFPFEGTVVSFINQFECEVKIEEIGVVSYPKNYCLKLLGEISPEAVWVKEGDEFDQYNLINSYGEVFDRSLYNPYKDKDKNYTIALECPNCNHFH